MNRAQQWLFNRLEGRAPWAWYVFVVGDWILGGFKSSPKYSAE